MAVHARAFDERTIRVMMRQPQPENWRCQMIGIGIAAAIGAAIGAVALGAVSVATHGDAPGLAIALQHIPPTTHGYEVVTAVKNALAGGAAGGGGTAAAAAPRESRGQGARHRGPHL